jgi:hypothetical protein
VTQSLVADGVHFDASVWNAKYRPKEALEAYQTWLKSRRRASLERAVRLALPVVRNRIYKKFKFPVVRPGDIATEASYRVFMAMRKGQINGDKHTWFRRDLRKIVRLSVNDVYSFLKPVYLVHGHDFYRATVSHTEAVEYKIFMERDLPRLLKRYVIERLRFEGKRREACLYILDRLTRRVVVGRDTISREFGQPDPGFLCDYIVVMLRRGLYEYRDDICPNGVVNDWYDRFRQCMPAGWLETEPECQE